MEENKITPATENRFNQPVKRKCRYCGEMYEVKTGINNFKNLFRKPSFDDYFILFMLILALVGSYFYYHDVKACHETLNNLDKVCERYALTLSKPDSNNTRTNYNPMNFSLGLVPNINQSADSIKSQVDNYSGKLARIENKINSIPFFSNGSK